jgi:hypothetical protein
MRTVLLASLVLAACGPGARPAGSADEPVVTSPVADASTGGAPCYPDRASVSAAELFDATHAGAPGACRIEWEVPDLPTGDIPEPDPVVYDGDRRVAEVFPCAISVLVPGVLEDHGIGVGDDAAVIAEAYPVGDLHHELSGNPNELLVLRAGDVTVARFELDGRRPAAYGEAALEGAAGQHIVEMTIMGECQ